MDIISLVLVLIASTAGIAVAAALGKLDKLQGAVKKAKNISLNNKYELLDTIDYGIYKMNPIELMRSVLIAAAVLIFIGYIFYRSIIMALLLAPFAAFYPQIRTRQIIVIRKNELKLQFKDALQSLSSSLHAGKSLESAMKGAIADLLIQYEPDSYIVREFEIITRKLESNETIENAFANFAERSKVEEIQGFAEVLEISKRSGGNLITAIKSSTEIIADKIEVFNDIQGILAEKKLEQYILSAMPIMLIFMLSTTAKDFMQPVYTEVIGRIAMTISILLFVLAYFVSDKITNIEV